MPGWATTYNRPALSPLALTPPAFRVKGIQPRAKPHDGYLPTRMPKYFSKNFLKNVPECANRHTRVVEVQIAGTAEIGQSWNSF